MKERKFSIADNQKYFKKSTQDYGYISSSSHDVRSKYNFHKKIFTFVKK